jgi:hypothetical protein
MPGPWRPSTSTRCATATSRSCATTPAPGLVELFTRLAADAANPEHPSRAFFAERGAGLRDRWAGTIADAQAEGRIRSDVDPVLAARLLQAVSDGAQMQLLVEPSST